MLLVSEKTLESSLDCKEIKSVLNIHWKDWCWSWNSNTLAFWCEELTSWKRPWCWERLKARGEADDRGWDGWMASPSQWTWVWASSRSWWWTGKPGVLQSMGSQRVRHDWATELNWLVLGEGGVASGFCFIWELLLTSSVCIEFSWPWSPIADNKTVSFLLIPGYLSQGNFLLFSGRKGKEGQSILLVPIVFQVSLAQNNHCGKVAYLGIVYSANLQLDLKYPSTHP